MTRSQVLTIDFTQPKEAAKVLPHDPILSSHHAGWKQISLQVYGPSVAWEMPTHISTHHLLKIALEGGTTLERRIGDRYKTEKIHTGDCLLIPESVEHWCAWSQPIGGFLAIEIEHNAIAKFACEAMAPDRTELLPTFLKPDPLLHRLGIALYDTLTLPQSCDLLYVETLTQTLAMHLLQHYATHQFSQDSEIDKLSCQQLKRVLDYIDNNLNRDIILTHIPIHLGMSQYRFSRSFQKSMGMSPYQYIIQERVKQARQFLSQTPQLSLAKIAQKCGFRDRKHLTKHLESLMGISSIS